MQTNAKETSGSQSIVVAGGYSINSNETIEKEDCGLVQGHGLQVKDAQGQIVYENLRGFLYLSDNANLVRFADKVWALVFPHKSRKIRLKKINLCYEGVVVFFDDKGKIRLNQVNPAYPTVDNTKYITA